MKTFLDFIVAAAIMTIVVILGVLPARISNTVGQAFGKLLYVVIGSWRRVALNNLRNVYGGSVEGPVRAVFAHIGRSVAELSRIALGRREPFENIRMEGFEHFEQALSLGRGVILIAGHCGNWELMAHYFGQFARITVVARKLDNPFLEKLIHRFRTVTGTRIIHKTGALKTILGELRHGGVVGFLMDQGVFETEGVLIDFLGHPAWVMKIPAVLAMKTGAAVIPIFSHRREDGGHTIVLEPPVPVQTSGDAEEDVRENTRRFSARVEHHVRQFPDQWLWIHRRWKRAAEKVWEKV